jgi:complex I intermediate-associated protein 30 (CIA30)
MNCVTKILLALLLAMLAASIPILAEEPGTWKLDDFEDGNLKSAAGLTWFLLADDIAGGASEARIEVRPGGAPGSKRALRVTGRLDDKDGWPFAGVWSNLDASGRSVNLGAFEGIRLRVKGPARLDVGLRSGMNNFMAGVEAGPGWKLVDVPFATLSPRGKVAEGTKWSPDAVQVFGVTTPQAPGEYKPNGKVDFELDDVVLYGQGPGKAAPVASGPPGSVSSQPFTALAAIPKTGWIDLGSDPEGDGRKGTLPDATRLEAIPASPDGMLWVRITLRETPHDRWMGVNVALDVDGDPADGFAWWGANQAFKFDRVVTVWCFRHGDRCEGYIGVADADQAAAGNYIPSPGGGLRFAIDRQRKAYVVGIPRASLGPAKQDIRLVAAVGSALFFADDVPGQGAATLR